MSVVPGDSQETELPGGKVDQGPRFHTKAYETSVLISAHVHDTGSVPERTPLSVKSFCKEAERKQRRSQRMKKKGWRMRCHSAGCEPMYHGGGQGAVSDRVQLSPHSCGKAS